MRSDQQVYDLLIKLFTEVYKHTDPPVEFDHDKLVEEYGDHFFNHFYIDRDIETALVEKFIARRPRLKEFKKKMIRSTYYLKCSPCTNKELVECTRCLKDNERAKNE